MTISLVVAATDNNVIGKNNQLMWHLPKDMAFFKNTTWAMPVVMGRKTWESMKQPLKGRENIIITRDAGYNPGYPGVIVVSSLDKALAAAYDTGAKECFVIGGGEIFRVTMNKASRIYMTRVHAELEGDTFFPDINQNIWELKSSRRFEADDKHAFPFTFETWERKTAGK